MSRHLALPILAGSILLALGACRPSPSSQPPAAPHRAATPLQPGDIVPDVAFVDQSGQTRSLQSIRPRAVVVTFIFTRCAMMEFCPRMSLKFQEVRQALDAGPLRDQVELVSFTLDPSHDTADALATYARTFEARPGLWSFARCERADLEDLKTRFGVRAAPAGTDGMIEHNLITAVIGPQGQVHRIWDGNAWTTDEITASLTAAVSGFPKVADAFSPDTLPGR
jgi:protein SCO1/2